MGGLGLKMGKANGYYYQKKEEIIKEYDSDSEKGLSEEEIDIRLKKYGKNKLKKAAGVSIWEVLYDQIKDVMVILLFFTSLFAFIIGDLVEALAIIAIIIFNTILGFATEYNAEKSMESLKKILTPSARVIRGGNIREINAENLVPGDIILLKEGVRISADGRLLESNNLSVNESVLTGESETVNKSDDFQAGRELPLAERKNMVYMGTIVSRGSGKVLVTATGSDTEMGQIGNLLEETENEDTPLEERLDQMGKSLIKITLLVTVIITIFGLIVGNPIIKTIKTGIALAIAAVPEGLPIIATITLAIGMSKMVKNNALVRKLQAVETLGSTTTICTDKTGTITENQMTLKNIYLSEKNVKISGSGYQVEGKFFINDDKIDVAEDQDISLFLKVGTLCSNAVIQKDENKDIWEVLGSPTEGALVTAARKADYDRELLEEEGYKRLAEVPFSSERMYMAVAYRTAEANNYIYVKGSPSIVIDYCNSLHSQEGINDLTEDRKKILKEKNKEMGEKGLRVLAIAYKEAAADTEEKIKKEMDKGLTFLGFAGIMDPPREGVKETITMARQAGISTRLITGDQEDTALSIAEKVGINSSNNEAKSVTGKDIDNMSVDELKESIAGNCVFSRVSPENKLQIIDALNKSDEITAMTGDGVNDAPALKKADIGVSMGQRGTSVARQASDMVLLDDSFSTIVKAIKEGRIIFDNIQKFIYFLFTNNLSKIIFIFMGIVLQIPLPLLALQILWINLVIDVFPALALAWEEPEPDIMNRPPRDPGKSILNKKFNKKLYLHSTIQALGPLLIYLFALNKGFSIEMSRTIGFHAISFAQLFHVFDARRKSGIGFDKTLFKNKYLWFAVLLGAVLQLTTIYIPFMQNILSTTTVPFSLWPLLLLGFIAPIVIIQHLKVWDI